MLCDKVYKLHDASSTTVEFSLSTVVKLSLHAKNGVETRLCNLMVKFKHQRWSAVVLFLAVTILSTRASRQFFGGPRFLGNKTKEFALPTFRREGRKGYERMKFA